jgi:hypothetical protein
MTSAYRPSHEHQFIALPCATGRGTARPRLRPVLSRLHLVLIAESGLNDPRVIRGREAGGYGIDGQ